MKTFSRISLVLSLLVSVPVAFGQERPTALPTASLQILEIEPHLDRLTFAVNDRKILYHVSSTTQKDVLFFGSKDFEQFYPIRVYPDRP